VTLQKADGVFIPAIRIVIGGRELRDGSVEIDALGRKSFVALEDVVDKTVETIRECEIHWRRST
jgi:hypothetical protein